MSKGAGSRCTARARARGSVTAPVAAPAAPVVVGRPRRRSSGLSTVELRAAGKHVRGRFAPTVPIVRVLRTLEASCGDRPLSGMALRDVRILLAASGLRARELPVTHEHSPLAAFICDRLGAGTFPADVYRGYVDGKTDSGRVVEHLLGLNSLNAELRLPISERLREQTEQHDHRRCCLSGRIDELAIDHYLPVAIGGYASADPDNLWCMHGRLNGSKGGRFPNDRLERAFASTGRKLPCEYVNMLSPAT